MHIHLQAKELYAWSEALGNKCGLQKLHKEGGTGDEHGKGVGLACREGRIRVFQAGSSVRAQTLGSGVSTCILSIDTAHL